MRHRSYSVQVGEEHQPLLVRSPSADFINYSINRSRRLLKRARSFGKAPIVVVSSPIPPETEDSNKRWIILLLSCCLLFGNYYAYDLPAALNVPLRDYLGHDYNDWQFELNLLYAVYSFPNIILPFFGGQLIDVWNPSSVLVLFSLLVCAGQTLFSLGVSLRRYDIMLAGRILFGIGGESISVVQSSITSRWFMNKELAFALGMNLCISRFGSVVNAICSPRLEHLFGPNFAVWTGTTLCYLSFMCAIILSHLDSKPQQNQENPSILRQLKDIIHFPITFWLICLICICLYGTVVPFNNIAQDFLMSKWFPNDTETVGLVMSIPDTISAFMVPFFGVIIDRYGKRASSLLLCSIVIACVHLTLGLSSIFPVYPLIFLGLSYSIYGVAIWPSVATVISHQEHIYEENGTPKRLLGSAFGVSTSALNLALTIMPLVAAQIRVGGGSFIPVEMFFVTLASVGAIFSIVLYIADSYDDSVLQKPEHQID